MKRFFIITVILSFVFTYSFGVEKLLFKSNDRYTGNLVLFSKERTVIVIDDKKLEFQTDKIEQVDFKDSQDEFEIVLSDKSTLRGSVVDQDEEFYTIGSGAGLTTIKKEKVMEIRNANAKYKDYFVKEKKYNIDFHFGMTPSTTFVLNDLNTSYQAYWSYEMFFESTFFTKAWFGVDISYIMLVPNFGAYTDYLFIIPINFTIKYQDNFFRPKQEGNPLRNLFWYIKMGIGFAPVIFAETAEKRYTYAMSFSSEAEFGIKYYITKFFAVGIDTKTELIVQKNSYVAMQSGGLILEFKF